MQGTWVQPLVGELRFCKPCGTASNNNNNVPSGTVSGWRILRSQTTNCSIASLGPEKGHQRTDWNKARKLVCSNVASAPLPGYGNHTLVREDVGIWGNWVKDV